MIMFLDDQLLSIGRNCDLTEIGTYNSVKEMLEVCWSNMQRNLSEDSTPQDIINTVKRINRTWNMTAKQLEKEGRGFVKADGFTMLILEDERFKGIEKFI